MKSIFKCTVIILLFICCKSSFAQSEQRAISGASVSTPDLHNVSCGSVGNCQCSLDDRWCSAVVGVVRMNCAIAPPTAY